MSECSICGEEPEKYGDKVCSSCLFAPSTASSKAKTFQSVVKSMSERKLVEGRVPRAPNKVTVFSRQYKSKLCELTAGVYLRFDEAGYALLDAHLVNHVRDYLKYKPGRLKIVPAEVAKVEDLTIHAQNNNSATAGGTLVLRPGTNVEVAVDVVVGEDEPEEGVELEIFVGEDEPEEGVELEIVVGEDPNEEESKNKEDDEPSDKNES